MGDEMRVDTSPSIGALAAALAKAQGEMDAAERDRTAHVKSDKGNFTYHYATLAGVWSACRKPLAENGLAVIQTTINGGESVTVRTILAHASGEWIAGELSMRPAAKDPQSTGSALTYLRKYALAAMVGIAADDDDDGAAGSKPEGQTHTHAISKREYDGTGAHFKFGKQKGASLAEGTVKDLTWYAEAIRKSVDDPEKAQYVDSNRKHLAAVEAELAKRTEAPAPSDEPGSHDGPPPDADALAAPDEYQHRVAEQLEHWRGIFKDAAKDGAAALSMAYRQMSSAKLEGAALAQLKIDYDTLAERLRAKKGSGK